MSSIDKYQKARGHRATHRTTAENIGDSNETPAPKTSKTKERAILVGAFATAASLVLGGLFYTQDSETPVAQEVKQVRAAPAPPKVVYKTRWRDKIVYKYIKSPPEVVYKYIKDPLLEQTYRRRMAMMRDFYTKPVEPGYKRTLTFSSDCPSVTPTVARGL